MEQEPYSFRNLALWQRAQELTLKIIRITEALAMSGLLHCSNAQLLRGKPVEVTSHATA